MKEGTSYNAMGRLFASRPQQQQIQDFITELARIKKAYEANPREYAFRDRVIQLNCKCGDIHLERKEYAEALQYFNQATQVAPEDHYLKLDISTKILLIAEERANINLGAASAGPR